jgi:microsomal dipeptidase-like Zn-dependent dipeptidase
MVHCILTHEVENFSTWHSVFSAAQPDRERYGIMIDSVYQSLDNPNFVIVASHAESKDNYDHFMADSNMRATMQEGGVKGMPAMQMMTKV